MAKNIQSLQLLRNTSQLYANREAALTALTGGTLPAGTQDGTPVLARYKGEDGKIYTLVGYYADSTKISGTTTGETNMTVFDFEGSAADVDKLRQEINAKLGSGVTSANTATVQFAALSGNTQSQSGETSVEGAKRYADEKVRAALDALDASTVSGESKVVIDVTQNNGQITASAANLTGVKLDGLAATADIKIASTDTLGEALGKLQGQIDSMDLSAVGTEGSVITSVSEEDGKVSAAATPVKDVKLTGYVKDTTKTGDIAATDDIEDAFSKLENKAAAITIKNDDGSINVTSGADGTNINVNIKSTEKVIKKDGNGGLYTDLDLVKITENLPTTVKERYQLLASDDSQIGANIDIYKDSSISKIYLGYSDDTVDENTGVITSGTTGEPQSLNYVYHKEDGKYEMVHVDVSKFLVESEFASGVTADTTGVVHGVVDPTSEKNSGNTASFLTVGEDGFKVDGIKNEIINRINELDASVSGTSTVTEDTLSGHIRVVVDEADGKLTAVTVNEKNIADADKLVELSGKTVTEVASSNNSITAALSAATDGTKHLDIITDASKIQMSGFTSTDVLSGISATSFVTEAFEEVDKVITENEQVVSAALNDLEATKAEKTALEAEITARKAVDGQNGDTYAANTSAKYISGATSLNDADLKLDAAIANITTGFIDGVQVNGIDLDETNNKVNVQITAGTTATDTPNAINVATNENTGEITLTLGTIDAGTY